MRSSFSKEEIERLLHALNDELAKDGVKGQLALAGGAVMCLAFDGRRTTKDLDGVFQPSTRVLEAALRVAAREGLRDTWLNDDVKGYLSDRGRFVPFLDLSHLKVSHAPADYMLAMKCLALRIGEGFQDERDIRYLLRNLGVRDVDEAREILARYYPLERYPDTALLAVEEMLAEGL